MMPEPKTLLGRMQYKLAYHRIVDVYLMARDILKSGKAILPSFVPEYKHLKTGNSYCVVIDKDVMIESTWKPGVLYMNEEGVLVVRDKQEFYDGRFEKIVPEKIAQETSDQRSNEDLHSK